MKPTICRHVIYRMENGVDRPAVVSGIDDAGLLTLHVFCNDKNISQFGVSVRTGVTEGTEPTQWRWPDAAMVATIAPNPLDGLSTSLSSILTPDLVTRVGELIVRMVTQAEKDLAQREEWARQAEHEGLDHPLPVPKPVVEPAPGDLSGPPREPLHVDAPTVIVTDAPKP